MIMINDNNNNSLSYLDVTQPWADGRSNQELNSGQYRQ